MAACHRYTGAGRLRGLARFRIDTSSLPSIHFAVSSKGIRVQYDGEAAAVAVGMDIVSGQLRLTFGAVELMRGFSLRRRSFTFSSVASYSQSPHNESGYEVHLGHDGLSERSVTLDPHLARGEHMSGFPTTTA